ncbi:MAG: DegV family protein [Defluviitaleaceae bacterium]|nr:DegV family protein [Defluviitaleaceae bacterium]
MREIKIVSDTSCELRQTEAAALGVDIVPFTITLDGVNYIRDIDISLEDFYKKIAGKDVKPKTSLPSPGDYFEVFERNVKEGKDIICLCLSSALSGSYQSAVTASEEIHDKYPEARVHVIDTKTVTWITWSLIVDAIEMMSQGADAEKIVAALKDAYNSLTGALTVDSLEHLVRGGRLSKVAGLAGSVLDIKPIIHFQNGSLVPGQKIRGRKKVVLALVDLIAEAVKGKDLSEYRFFTLYGGNEEYGKDLRSLMAEKLEISESDIKFGPIGTVLGCHGGPTVSIAACVRKINI